MSLFVWPSLGPFAIASGTYNHSLARGRAHIIQLAAFCHRVDSYESCHNSLETLGLALRASNGTKEVLASTTSHLAYLVVT